MFKKIVLASLGVLVFFSFSGSVWSQTQPLENFDLPKDSIEVSSSTNFLEGEGVKLPLIYVRDVEIENKKYSVGDYIKGTFSTFSQSEYTVSGISFHIYMKDTSNSSLHEIGKLDPIVFAPKERKKISFESKKIPNFLDQNKLYSVLIIAEMNSGLSLGWWESYDFRVFGGKSYLEVISGGVLVKDKIYGPESGPTLDPKNKEIKSKFFLRVNNLSQNDLEIIPSVAVGIFGKDDLPISFSGEKILLKAGEKEKFISIDLPKFDWKPDVYVGKFFLKSSNGEILIPEADFRYIIGGQIAKIHSIRSDKTEIKKGENMNLIVDVTGTPLNIDLNINDQFKEQDNSKVTLKVEIFNERNKLIGEFQREMGIFDLTRNDFIVSASKSAKAMKAKVSIYSEDKILDTLESYLSANYYEIAKKEKFKRMIWSAISIISALIFALFVFFLKRGNKISKKNKTKAKILAIFILFIIGLLGSMNYFSLANAGSWTFGGNQPECGTYYSPQFFVNSPYPGELMAPGQSFSVQFSGRSTMCGNSDWKGGVTMNNDGVGQQSTEGSLNGNGDPNYWLNFDNPPITFNTIASDVPGTHYINFYVWYQNGSCGGELRTYVPYTVVSDPECGLANGIQTSAKPTTDLCDQYSEIENPPSETPVTLLDGTKVFRWSCRNTVGATIQCSAPQTPVSPPACGSAVSGPPVGIAPSSNLCAEGNTPTEVSFDNSRSVWFWSCSNGQASVRCERDKHYIPLGPECGDVNGGYCSSAPSGNDLCSSGNSSSNPATLDPSNSDRYLWACSLEGRTKSCSCQKNTITSLSCGPAANEEWNLPYPTEDKYCEPSDSVFSGFSSFFDAIFPGKLNLRWTCSKNEFIVGCSAYSNVQQPECGTAHNGRFASFPADDTLCDAGAPENKDDSWPRLYSWDCRIDGNPQVANCLANKGTTQLSCGSDAGVSTTIAPSSNLCLPIMEAYVDGSVTSNGGFWNWTCRRGDSTVSCQAPNPNGLCGSANGGTFYGLADIVPPRNLLCSGEASAGTPPVVNLVNGIYYWHCQLGNQTHHCQANQGVNQLFCGFSAGRTDFGSIPANQLDLCGPEDPAVTNSGINSDITSGSTVYFGWTCSRGNKTISCSASDSDYLPRCGPAQGRTFIIAPSTDLCSSGDPVPTTANTVNNGGVVNYEWTCNKNSITTNCIAYYGTGPSSCGQANGGFFDDVPTENLCLEGSLSGGPDDSLPNTYEWQCSTENCMAFKTPLCGPASISGDTFSTAPPVTELCERGSSLNGANLQSNLWEWKCELNGREANCQANVEIEPRCGSANNTTRTSAPTLATELCSQGDSNPASGSIDLNGTTYNWQCILEGYGVVNCSANYMNIGLASCGSSHTKKFDSQPISGLCGVGTNSSLTFNSTTNKWTWTCTKDSDVQNCWAEKSKIIDSIRCGNDNGKTNLTEMPVNKCTPNNDISSVPVKNGIVWSWTCGSGADQVNCSATTGGTGTGRSKRINHAMNPTIIPREWLTDSDPATIPECHLEWTTYFEKFLAGNQINCSITGDKGVNDPSFTAITNSPTFSTDVPDGIYTVSCALIDTILLSTIDSVSKTVQCFLSPDFIQF